MTETTKPAPMPVPSYLERAEADNWRKQTAVYQLEEVTELRERLRQYEPRP